jgi:hypothetical protein
MTTRLRIVVVRDGHEPAVVVDAPIEGDAEQVCLRAGLPYMRGASADGVIGYVRAADGAPGPTYPSLGMQW